MPVMASVPAKTNMGSHLSCSKYKRNMVEAGGAGICSGIENTQIIEKASCSKTPKTQKLGLTGTYLERGNFAFLRLLLVKMKVGLVYRCLAAGWRAVAK